MSKKLICPACSNAIIQETEEGFFKYDGSLEVSRERRTEDDAVEFRVYCTIMHTYICQKEKFTKCSAYKED